MSAANQPLAPASLETALVALGWISPNGTRKHWASMGMALKSEFGEEAKDGFIAWSSLGDGYKALDTLSAWKSFKGSAIGIGTLFAEALTEGFKFEKSTVRVSPEKLAADRAARDARNAKTEADRIKAAQAASVRAASQWRMAAPVGQSPYLVRKQVQAESCRFLPDGGLILPMMDYAPERPRMVGKQFIDAAGVKKNSHGMDKKGAACRLGDIPEDGDDIGLGEGYVTCLTVRAATEWQFPVFVGFDAGNLIHVARILRTNYPASRIIIFGDDDYLTGQPGLAAAHAAAAAVGNALVIMPAITAPRRATKTDESLPKLTDFNDLHVTQSLAVVTEQIQAGMAVVSAASSAPPVVDAALLVGLATLDWCLAHCALVQGSTDVWDGVNKFRMKRAAFVELAGKEVSKTWSAHGARRSISPRHLPKLQRGVAVPEEGAGADNIVMMLGRYTLLYGTKTVWDADKKVILGYDAMQLARGELATRWLEHPLRREIDHDKLVFDPTQRCDLDMHINLFEGFPLTPKEDETKANLVLDLLYSLCASETNYDEVFRWVLSWLAYPLQHPGAKMQTGLLFFGEKQGTGKSLFFEGIIKPIYGAHGATGAQHQLDSTWTTWRSQKLYVLFEEILSRQDKYSHFGLIKHMITGRDTSISKKFQDDRSEDNHMNVVMLSNEFQAIPLEPEDRRFLVVNALQMLDAVLLAQIKVLLDQGGDGLIEAFYHFLLNYPLGEFDPHTKPLMTQSKARVINFGRPDWEAFYLSWAAGDLIAPYCSCLSTDLYVVYARHCSKYGFRTMSITKFSELIAQRVRKDREWVLLQGMSKKKLLTLFIVPCDDEQPDESYSAQCERFRATANIKESI